MQSESYKNEIKGSGCLVFPLKDPVWLYGFIDNSVVRKCGGGCGRAEPGVAPSEVVSAPHVGGFKWLLDKRTILNKDLTFKNVQTKTNTNDNDTIDKKVTKHFNYNTTSFLGTLNS